MNIFLCCALIFLDLWLNTNVSSNTVAIKWRHIISLEWIFKSVMKRRSVLTQRSGNATLRWRGPARTARASSPHTWPCAREPPSSEPPPGWTSHWSPPSGPCYLWLVSHVATAWRWQTKTSVNVFLFIIVKLFVISHVTEH